MTVAATASEAWLTHVGGRKGGLPAAARHILTTAPEPASSGLRSEATREDGATGGYGARASGASANITVPELGFANGYDESGALVATARGVVVDGWLGLSVLGVDPGQRRRGWGRRLTGALAAWALDRAASRAYLQVEARNEPAVALYVGLGFRTAHSYVVRHSPIE